MLPAEECLSRGDRNQPSVSRVTQVTTDSVTGQTTYEARQGSKRLELVVGSMALQVSKGGKPVESILYKDMAGWQHDAGIRETPTLFRRLSTPFVNNDAVVDVQ